MMQSHWMLVLGILNKFNITKKLSCTLSLMKQLMRQSNQELGNPKTSQL